MKYSFGLEMRTFGAFVATLLLVIFTGCSDSSTNPDGANGESSAELYETLCSSPVENGAVNVDSSFRMNKLFSLTDKYGITKGSLYMSKPLAESIVDNNNLYTTPLMLVLRKDTQGKAQVFGFFFSTISGPVDKGEEGLLYRFEGYLRDIYGNMVEGVFLNEDIVLFNVPWSYDLEDDGNSEFDYTYEEWLQLMAWAKLTDVYITSSSGEKITGFTGANAPHVLSKNSCSAYI